MNKTRYILFTITILAFAGAIAACWITTQPSAPIPTNIPNSLACYVHDDKSMIKWPNIPASDIPISNINHMVSEGDLLWAATNRGLVRLNVRSWQCDLFAQALGFPLANASPLIATEKGRLWVNNRPAGRLLFFDGEHWHPSRKVDNDLKYTQVIALGFDWAGVLHAQTAFDRFGVTYQPLECNRWPQASRRDYSYTTADGCDHIRHLLEQIGASEAGSIAASDDNQVWLVSSSPHKLYHWQNDAIEYSTIPYEEVNSIAIDPIYGGAWLATKEKLVHIRSENKSGPDKASLTEASFVYQMLSLYQEAFEGSASALAVDANDQMWAVNGQSVLRYEKADLSWRRVTTATHSADAIAADPMQGVWVAGRGELVYLGEQILRWPAPGGITPTALLVDGDRRLWLGTLEDGVWTTMPSESADPLVWQKFSNADGLPDLRITALARGPHGHVYAAHHAGVSLFDPGIERWITLPNSAPAEPGWANALAFDRAGRLWVGYYPGATVRLYEDGRWLDYSLPPAEVYGVDALLVDAEGTLWAGTSSPVGRFPRERWYLPTGVWRWSAAGDKRLGWESFEPESGDFEPADDYPILHNALALALDAEGRIWVGGEEGVSVWEGE